VCGVSRSTSLIGILLLEILNFYLQILRLCTLNSPIGNVLNDNEAGTGTSTKDWINLVVGEGGVIDWISPGWRGEYQKS
jgi:hypothetical protein